MRRFIVIFILFVYTASIPGVTMATHFCMNMDTEMEATMGYGDLRIDDCSLCHQTSHAQEEKSDCCQSSSQFIKTTPDQDFSVPDLSIQTPIFIIEDFYLNRILVQQKVNPALKTNGTILSDIPIYKQVRSFRI